MMNMTPNTGFFKQGKYFIVSAIATVLVLVTHSKAQASTSAPLGGFVSPITIIFLIIGIAVCVFYIKAMLTILHEAASSYIEAEEEADGSYYASPAWGAALAGVIAAVVIWSYGLGPSFFYLGPVLAMISPIAILYCMSQDIQNYRATHMKLGVERENPASELIEH